MVAAIAWAGLGTVVEFMGASVPLWAFLLIALFTAILKPSVLKYVIGIGVLFFIVAFTDITLIGMFWIGVVLFIIYLVTNKQIIKR